MSLDFHTHTQILCYKDVWYVMLLFSLTAFCPVTCCWAAAWDPQEDVRWSEIPNSNRTLPNSNARKQRELQLFLWNWCGLLQIAIVQWYLRTHQYSFEVKFCETEPNEDCSCPLVSWRPSLLEVITPTCHVSKSVFHPDVCAAQDPTNSTWLCITQHPSTQPGNVRFQRPWNAFAVWSRWWKSWAMWRVDAYGAVPGC